ncbi:LamG-like jellyroll fold domain-containing protein [Calditrichota bacterium]
MKISIGVLTLLIITFGMPVSAICGYALEFDGDDDYVSLNHQALDGLEDCTVEYWVIINEEDAGAATISGAQDAANMWNEYLHWFDFASGFGPHIKQTLAYLGNFPTEEWFHLAVTRDGDTGEWIAYQNGEEWVSTDFPNGALIIDEGGLILGQEQDALGGGFSPEQALLGQMDELRIWNYVRSEEEVLEAMNVMIDPGTEGLVAYYRFDEGEGQELTDLTENEYHGRLGDDEDEDDADPTWVESEAPIFGGVLSIDPLEIELEPLIIDEEIDFTLILENVSEEEDDNLAIDYEIVAPEEDRPDWFEFTTDNLSGTLEVGEVVEIEMKATGNVEPGLYEYSFNLNNNSVNYQRQEIPVTVWITDGFGLISGEVKDADGDEPFEGATVELFSELDFVQLTDENGDFEFVDMPAADYTIRVTLEGYIPFEEEFQLEDEGEVEFEIWLYHGEFDAGDDIALSIEPPPESDSRIIELTNDGNGPVNWSSQIIFPQANVEPFTIMDTIWAEAAVNDPRLEGVLFIDDHYYVAGSNGDDLNYLYVLNRDGELVRSFTQPDSSRLGSKDLAWDGDLIWITKGSYIWGMTKDGDIESTLDSPHNSTSFIAYDTDRGYLWVSSTTSEIVGIDLNGNEQLSLPRFNFRKSGLAYFPDDPDGYSLYVLHFRDDINLLHKINPETGDSLFVTKLNEGIDAGSAFISHDYDSNLWTFMTVNQVPTDEGGDEVVVYQLGPKTSWISMDPQSGTIDENSAVEAEISFDTRWLGADTYEAQFVFTHDGFIGEDTIDVSLEVIRPSEPDAPSDLSAEADAPRHISLTWTDNADNEEGFKLWRKSEEEEDYSLIADLAEDIVSYTDSIHVIYLNYSYMVQAYNGVGESIMSNQASATALGSFPSEFNLLSPENGSQFYFQVEEDSTLLVLFSWEESIDPDPEDKLDYTMSFGLWDEVGDSISNVLFFKSDSSQTSYDLLQVLADIDHPAGASWDFRWWVQVNSGPDTLLSSNQMGFNISIGEGVGSNFIQPIEFGLHEVYPNPFNGLLRIRYGLEVNTEAAIVVYDLAGRTVAEPVSGVLERGMHIITWDASTLPSGVYLVQLIAGERMDTRKVLLIR